MTNDTPSSRGDTGRAWFKCYVSDAHQVTTTNLEDFLYHLKTHHEVNGLVPPDQEANTEPSKAQSSPSATTKTLEELVFSQKYPIKNKHLKDCAFVWQDEGQCKCETEIPKALTAINSYTTQRVIEELENFEWNDPHHYVNTRLAELRESLKGGIDE